MEMTSRQMCLTLHHKGLWPEKAFQTNWWDIFWYREVSFLFFFKFYKIVHFHKLYEYISYLTEHHELKNKHRSLISKIFVPSTCKVLSIHDHSCYIFFNIRLFLGKSKILNQEAKWRTSKLGYPFIKIAKKNLFLPIVLLQPTL